MVPQTTRRRARPAPLLARLGALSTGHRKRGTQRQSAQRSVWRMTFSWNSLRDGVVSCEVPFVKCLWSVKRDQHDPFQQKTYSAFMLSPPVVELSDRYIRVAPRALKRFDRKIYQVGALELTR